MGAFLYLLLVPNGQPVAVPVQDLEPVAALVTEHEEMARQRVARQEVAHQRRQAVEGAALPGAIDLVPVAGKALAAPRMPSSIFRLDGEGRAMRSGLLAMAQSGIRGTHSN